MDLNAQLDKLKLKLGARSDAELAAALDIKPPTLSQMRNGVRPFSPKVIARTLDLLGYVIARDKFVELLLSKDAAEALREWDNRRAIKATTKKSADK